MSMADRDRRDKERGRLRRRRSKERDKERGRLRRRRSKERMREQRASEMGGEGWLDELLAVDAWETGVTAAVSSGATERAVALVHKAPAGAVRSGHGSDLLYRACERGQPAVADALLALGADANATHGTGRGDTALMIASGGGTTGLDMRAMHGRYWSYLGNDLQGRPRAADRQGITGRFNAVEPKMEGTPHTGRSDADRSNSADLEVGTKCAAELSTSSCGADDAGDGVAACTRANSVPMLLGVGDAGKAAGYYMLKYMGKPLCDPAASLDVFVAAAQHVTDPQTASTAADAHTSRRMALHFAQNVLNVCMQELEASFAAGIVLDEPFGD